MLLLLLPAVLLLAFALWQRSRVRTGPTLQGAPVAPEDSVQSGPVEGWEKRLSLGGAGDLELRLERLHPHDSRQAFDAAALAGRLGRGGEGAEPWRLVISSRAPEGTDVGDVLVTSLAQVRVKGLEPLVHEGERPSRGRLSDPLRTLLAFPDGDLRAGEAIDLVFWGKAPEGRAIVTLPGVDRHGAEPKTALLPLARLGSRASQSIATLDARRSSEGEGR